MLRAAFNYFLLDLAVMASTFAAISPEKVSRFQPWWSVGLVGLVVSVSLLLQGQLEQPRHGDRQKHILLVIIVAGVVASFQWLFLFQRHELTLIFQAVDGLFYLVVVGLLIIGQLTFARDLARGNRAR